VLYGVCEDWRSVSECSVAVCGSGLEGSLRHSFTRLLTSSVQLSE
jgi:hypothetical protein